jgi:hypothetical protein
MYDFFFLVNFFGGEFLAGKKYFLKKKTFFEIFKEWSESLTLLTLLI